MLKKTVLRQFITCASGSAMLLACGSASNVATQPAPSAARTPAQIKAEMNNVRASLATEVGTPLASMLSQCRAIPIGAKGCGGPSGYLVYSTQVSNESRLGALAERYSALEQEWNKASQAISTCSMVVPPRIEFIAGRCQVK